MKARWIVVVRAEGGALRAFGPLTRELAERLTYGWSMMVRDSQPIIVELEAPDGT